MAITIDTLKRTPVLKSTAAQLSKGKALMNLSLARAGYAIDADEFLMGSSTKACMEQFQKMADGTPFFTQKGTLTKEAKKVLTDAMKAGEISENASTWDLLTQGSGLDVLV